MDEKLKELQGRIGYHFHNEELLRHALTHTSYANEQRLGHTGSNERLEFLGDAVLELASSEFLYAHYPEMPEGDLSKTRASLVCEPTLAYCAEAFDLGSYLFLGKGEDATGGRKRNSVVSDAFEAVIGAIYLDGGFASAKEFVLKFVLDDMEHKKLFCDSKTILQETVQNGDMGELTYELLSESGPDHNKSFEFAAMVGGKEIGRGTGRTKKAAEQAAAFRGLLTLRNGGDKSCT